MTMTTGGEEHPTTVSTTVTAAAATATDSASEVTDKQQQHQQHAHAENVAMERRQDVEAATTGGENETDTCTASPFNPTNAKDSVNINSSSSSSNDDDAAKVMEGKENEQEKEEDRRQADSPHHPDTLLTASNQSTAEESQSPLNETTPMEAVVCTATVVATTTLSKVESEQQQQAVMPVVDDDDDDKKQPTVVVVPVANEPANNNHEVTIVDGNNAESSTSATTRTTSNAPPLAVPESIEDDDEEEIPRVNDNAAADAGDTDTTAAAPTDDACDSKSEKENNYLTATATTTTVEQRDTTIVANTAMEQAESSYEAVVDNVKDNLDDTAAKNNSTESVGSTSVEPHEKGHNSNNDAVVAVSSTAEPETSNDNDLKMTTPTASHDSIAKGIDKEHTSVKGQEPITTFGPSQEVTTEALVENREDAPTSPCAIMKEAVVRANGSLLPGDESSLPSLRDQQHESGKDAPAAMGGPSDQMAEIPSTVEKSEDVIVTEPVGDTAVVDQSPVEELAVTSSLPPQTPPPAAKDADNDGMRTPVVATETATTTTRIDGADAMSGMSTATPSSSTILAPSNGSGDGPNDTATDDAGSKLQSPPRLSAKTSSPQGVMDFHNIQAQGEDATYHAVVLFPMNSPQRQEAQLSATSTNTNTTIPSSSLDPKESALSDADEATSFLPRGLQASNKVKDIYRPNEKKEETMTHGFAELTKQNSLRNKQREDGLKVTSVTTIRKMFEKQTTASDSPMGLEAFHQQQAYRRQQSHDQKIEALAKMHGFSKEVIAEYLKKSAQGEVDYSHLAKLQDEIDKLKNANEIPDGLGRLEKSPHRRTRSTGEIDTSHAVNVDGVDRSDWKGPIATALSADAAAATGIIHPNCKATDYRGMIFVVHHQEGLMLLRGKNKDVVMGKSTGPDVRHEVAASTRNATGAHETSVPGGRDSSNTTLELHESDSLLKNNSTGPDVGHEGGGASTSNATEAHKKRLVSGVSSNAIVELHESDLLLKDLNGTTVGVDADTPLYQLPGGRISDDDALAAAQQSSNLQRQLLLAARAGAARQLYESTGIDVRSRLKDLVPAILKPDCDENAESTQLPNEHQNNIFFFLNVTDDDFVRPEEILEAASGVEQQDGKEKQVTVDDVKQGAPVVEKSDIQGERPTVPAGERLLLKLSNEHSGFMFEKEPARATELLKSDNTNIGVLSSEALELLTEQQKTLADKTSAYGAASCIDESAAPFTLDRCLQRQYHPTLGNISSYRSLADAKDTASDDAAHASENEEMASCKGGLAGATTSAAAAAAAASSPSALVDQDLQKSLDNCACCTVM